MNDELVDEENTAWIERDPDDDSCKHTCIDDRGLYVKCTQRGLFKHKKKYYCRKHYKELKDDPNTIPA